MFLDFDFVIESFPMKPDFVFADYFHCIYWQENSGTGNLQ
jgi:hypothetical protein